MGTLLRLMIVFATTAVLFSILQGAPTPVLAQPGIEPISVPEPGTLFLLGTGILLLTAEVRRRH